MQSKGFVSKSFKDISKKRRSGDLHIFGNVLFYQIKLLESKRNKAHSTYYHLYFTNRKGILMPKKVGGGGNNLRVIFKSILMINSLYCYSTEIAGPTHPSSVNENQEDLEVMFSSSVKVKTWRKWDI